MDFYRGPSIGPRLGFILAAGFYGGWAVALFEPYAAQLSSSFKLLYAINPAVGAMGVFLLSRRWLAGWLPGALAGLLYGFGPFGLSFLGFHPITGITFAAVPWLLLPATYWQRGRPPTTYRFAVRAVLSALPFAFIIAFFWTFSQHWVGPIFLLPKQTMLSGADLFGLVLPLSKATRPVVLGLYHAGLLTALMGLFVYLTVQRIMVLIPPLAGLLLAFLDPVLRVSPVVWASLPMVFLAILAGLGIQALILAGKSDSKWVLLCVLAGIAAGGVSWVLNLSDRPEGYINPALIYPATAGVLGVIFVLSRAGVRGLPVRWILLAGIIGVDCFWGASQLLGWLF